LGRLISIIKSIEGVLDFFENLCLPSHLRAFLSFVLLLDVSEIRTGIDFS